MQLSLYLVLRLSNIVSTDVYFNWVIITKKTLPLRIGSKKLLIQFNLEIADNAIHAFQCYVTKRNDLQAYIAYLIHVPNQGLCIGEIFSRNEHFPTPFYKRTT